MKYISHYRTLHPLPFTRSSFFLYLTLARRFLFSLYVSQLRAQFLQFPDRFATSPPSSRRGTYCIRFTTLVLWKQNETYFEICVVKGINRLSTLQAKKERRIRFSALKKVCIKPPGFVFAMGWDRSKFMSTGSFLLQGERDRGS